MIVYDGSNDQAQELASFCDSSQPKPIFSTGPTLYIKFLVMSHLGNFDMIYTTTDKEGVATTPRVVAEFKSFSLLKLRIENGFPSIKWCLGTTLVIHGWRSRGCGGQFHESYGKFSSPLYPSSYKEDNSCRWDISVPHGNQLVFKFLTLNFGYSLCNTNYIQLLDVDLTTGLESLHSQYCGYDSVSEIQMRGSTAVVRYVTTTHNNGTGWVLAWKSRPVLAN
ncbi:hypothetical protein J6590_068207 [Homalodisca vitripennis]|nr:hypothetical protein J6590_068207 [Homalodisca vitripennis]